MQVQCKLWVTTAICCQPKQLQRDFWCNTMSRFLMHTLLKSSLPYWVLWLLATVACSLPYDQDCIMVADQFLGLGKWCLFQYFLYCHSERDVNDTQLVVLHLQNLSSSLWPISPSNLQQRLANRLENTPLFINLWLPGCDWYFSGLCDWSVTLNKNRQTDTFLKMFVVLTTFLSTGFTLSLLSEAAVLGVTSPAFLLPGISLAFLLF